MMDGNARFSSSRIPRARILRNTPANGRIMAPDHAAIRHATGRRVQLLPVAGDRALLSNAIEKAQQDFLVINAPRPGDYSLPTEYQRLTVLEELLPGRLQRVARTPRGSIWRVAR